MKSNCDSVAYTRGFLLQPSIGYISSSILLKRAFVENLSVKKTLGNIVYAEKVAFLTKILMAQPSNFPRYYRTFGTFKEGR